MIKAVTAVVCRKRRTINICGSSRALNFRPMDTSNSDTWDWTVLYQDAGIDTLDAATDETENGSGHPCAYGNTTTPRAGRSSAERGWQPCTTLRRCGGAGAPRRHPRPPRPVATSAWLGETRRHGAPQPGEWQTLVRHSRRLRSLWCRRCWWCGPRLARDHGRSLQPLANRSPWQKLGCEIPHHGSQRRTGAATIA